jgi:hypothetical protein
MNDGVAGIVSLGTLLLGSGGGRDVFFFSLVLRAARGTSTEVVRVRARPARFVSAAFISTDAVRRCFLGRPSVEAVRSCFLGAGTEGLLGCGLVGGRFASDTLTDLLWRFCAGLVSDALKRNFNS